MQTVLSIKVEVMKRTSLQFGLPAAVVLAVGLSATPSTVLGKGKPPKDDPPDPPPVLYSVTMIDNTFGGTFVTVSDMNSDEVIVGYADDASGDHHAIIYTIGTGMVDLNSLLSDEERAGWFAKRAYGINEFGQITGSTVKEGVIRGFLYDPYAQDPDPRFILLPTPTQPGLITSVGKKINNFAEIVVRSAFEDSVYSHSIYRPDGTLTDIGDLTRQGDVTGFNDAGQFLARYVLNDPQEIVGSRFTPDGNEGYSEEFFPDLDPWAMNELGTFTGDTTIGLSRKELRRGATSVFRYTDELEILQDGTGNALGIGFAINNDGDIGIIRPLSIYTSYQNTGLLILEDLIAPDDVALFTGNTNSYSAIRAIGERDASGFFSIIIDGTNGRPLLLIPMANGS